MVYKNFVIVSLPRTGTTMLCIALNKLSGFNVYGEILVNKSNHMVIKKHPQEAIEEFRQKNKPKNFYSFLSKKYNFTDNEYPLKKIINSDINDYLNSIYAEEGNVGFKLLHPHIERLPYVISYIKNNDIKVIHLYRENGLKQIISALTNIYMHEYNGKKKMELNEKVIDKLPEKLKINEEKDKRISELFSKSKNYIKMSYEDMTYDNNAEMINVSKISDILEIPSKIKSYTKKYGPKEIKDRIVNII